MEERKDTPMPSLPFYARPLPSPPSHPLDTSALYLSLTFQSPAPLPKRTTFLYIKIFSQFESFVCVSSWRQPALVPYLNVRPWPTAAPLLGKKEINTSITLGGCHLYGPRRASTAPAPRMSERCGHMIAPNSFVTPPTAVCPLPCQGGRPRTKVRLDSLRPCGAAGQSMSLWRHTDAHVHSHALSFSTLTQVGPIIGRFAAH
ncbi:hypothetical protein BJV78DRAFT_781456 [Lactifluus subvellereus]|nr:hypothetical protein BJV78DRAFT_781456 [Lactifluus subvellereus]